MSPADDQPLNVTAKAIHNGHITNYPKIAHSDAFDIYKNANNTDMKVTDFYRILEDPNSP